MLTMLKYGRRIIWTPCSYFPLVAMLILPSLVMSYGMRSQQIFSDVTLFEDISFERLQHEQSNETNRFL